MRRTMNEVAEEMANRRLALTPAIERMMSIRDRYNSDVVVPVPNTDDDVPYDALTPLLIADAVDHPALYASQAPPNIFVPALDPTKVSGVRSTDFAMRRRKALHYAWDKSWWELVLGRFYRHLAAYATSVLMVTIEGDLPRIETRDPLAAYPEPKAPEDLTLPANVGFIKGVSLDWLHLHYPETRTFLPHGAGFAVADGGEGELWDVVEWIDEHDIVVGVLGPRDGNRSWVHEPVRWCYELSRYPNVLGRCTAVIPRRVTLDRVISQLSNLTGHVDLMAHLTYLDIRATERAVFPDRYVISKVGQNPRLVGGDWKDGSTGDVNMVIDADAIGELRGTPDPNNKITLDRLERAFRVSSGLIPQAGGETYGALRTGRGIDALMGAALDPRTTELHRIAERYLTEVNELLLTAYKIQYGARIFSVYSPLDPGAVEFVPNDHVERSNGKLFVDNRVSYPIPGMDDINATQVIGQMMGAELISRADARRMHPHINDPEGTERRLMGEQIDQLIIAALVQRASTPPGIPPSDLGRIRELVDTGIPLWKAMTQADREAQERQAAVPPSPQAPEAMPGLANPGEGAEMGGLTSVPGTPLEQFRALTNALRSTSPRAQEAV